MPHPPPDADDYYALLGVPPAADHETLRTAWRRLAFRWHPDRAGESATATFQQLSAAYTVLSDPVARAAYDRGRRRRGTAPTRPDRAPEPQDTRPPAPATMLSRLSGHLSMLLARGAADLDDEPGFITLLPTPREAAQGGMIMVSLRIDIRCPACTPDHPLNPCPRCHGSGTVQELFSAWLALRPGAPDGEILAPSAELPGTLHPVRFRIRLQATS
jgi:DnaJ-class molecular chaperone